MIAPIDSESVCAVIITHNRKDLLRECLTAVIAQTCSVSRILVIDNLSTDGTANMLSEEFSPQRVPQLEIVWLKENRGGAGGFHEGIKHAYRCGLEWLWLMDDDTIPEPSALRELLMARKRFSSDHRPDLLASKVLWTDGSLHAMNKQWIKSSDSAQSFRAAAAATFPLRAATFVSLLLHRRLVEEHGLPIAKYFLWGDDTEYTGRILKEREGVAVPASVVLHKTVINHGSSNVSPRFYFHVRNTLWMILRSRAFNLRDKITCLSQLVRAIARYLSCAPVSQYGVLLRGFWDGITESPQ